MILSVFLTQTSPLKEYKAPPNLQFKVISITSFNLQPQSVNADENFVVLNRPLNNEKSNIVITTDFDGVIHSVNTYLGHQGIHQKLDNFKTKFLTFGPISSVDRTARVLFVVEYEYAKLTPSEAVYEYLTKIGDLK